MTEPREPKEGAARESERDAELYPRPQPEGTMELVAGARTADPGDEAWYPFRTKVALILEPWFRQQKVPEDYQLSDLLCGVCARMEKSLATATFESREKFGGWLHTLAEREVRDEWRRVLAKKRGGGHKRAEADEDGFDPVDHLEGAEATPSTAARVEEILALERAGVAELPEHDQRVYLLRRQGLSYAEIAEELGHTADRPGLAKLRQVSFHACKKVQERMLEKLDGYESVIGRFL